MSLEKKRFNYKRWLAIFAIGMAYGSVYNPTYIRYIFYDAMIQTMQVSNVQLAALNAWPTILGLFLGMPGGWLADKYSAKKIVFFSVLGNLPLCIISVLTTEIYAIQIMVWLGFGITGGFAFWPAALKAVRMTSSPEQQNSAYGFFEACHGFSSMAGNFIAIWIFSIFVSQVAGFKGAMLSMGIWSAIGAFLLLWLYKEGEVTDDTITEKETGEKKGFKIKDTLIVLKNPGTWLVGVVIIGAYGIYLTQSYFTPYFTGVLGATVVFSAAMSNFRSYGMKMLAGPVGGFLATKLKSAAKLNAITLIVCFFLILYVSRLKPGTANVIAIATVFTLVLAFTVLMAKGTMWATMEEAHIPRRLTGTAVAIISYMAFNTTETILPLINGYWLDKYAHNLPQAYRYFFIILMCMAIAGAIAAILIVIRDKKYKNMMAQMPNVSEATEQNREIK